jgi:S-adenosyl methyltransferase
MAEDERALPGIDIRRPNMARMYDYALGGKDNFASDREAVQNLFRLAPENAYVPRAKGHRAVP